MTWRSHAVVSTGSWKVWMHSLILKTPQLPLRPLVSPALYLQFAPVATQASRSLSADPAERHHLSSRLFELCSRKCVIHSPGDSVLVHLNTQIHSVRLFSSLSKLLSVVVWQHLTSEDVLLYLNQLNTRIPCVVVMSEEAACTNCFVKGWKQFIHLWRWERVTEDFGHLWNCLTILLTCS